ncbi:MAG TPA: hypothetical protein VMB27_17990 [Solirubrobacteraceae bacterium]|nr:hypothetical protein [Solirubrobacteraceae bacterium]
MRRGGRTIIALAPALALAGTAVAAASPAPPNPLLFRACDATVTAVGNVVLRAATTPVQIITSHIRVTGPGTLTGKIAFNATGSRISVAADAPAKPSAAGGCAEGTIGPGVPKRRGHSVIVSTLRRTFTKAGRHTLTFKLDRKGEEILARLGAADRAYRKRHPHGFKAPSIAFGVGLTYEPAG